jgi:hypothetical protein
MLGLVNLAGIILDLQPPTMVSDQEISFLLSLIIPGPESVKMANFDIYLAPILEEL